MANFNDKSKISYDKKADHYDSTFEGRFTIYSPKEIINNFKPHGFEKIDIKISGYIQIISMQKI